MASLTGSMVNASTPVMRQTKAKQDTVDKICKIVRKQLAIPDETPITGESKFSELGADSLDIVDIMMGLEESFYISVDLESAQDIATVKDAAEINDSGIDSMTIERQWHRQSNTSRC